MDTTPTRRPLRTRQTRWAAATAGWLTRVGVHPNAISMLSVVFAAVAGLCLLLQTEGPAARRILLLLAAAAGIQLRLLCNLLDGMVAVEGGRKTKSGEVFNEVPDRLSDLLILVCAGYAVGGVGWASQLGWLAALLAVMTAYVRVLGGTLGLPQDFSGPMAKQQRMAVLTVACLGSAIEVAAGAPRRVLLVALAVIAAGAAMTVARRTYRIARALESR